MTFDKEASSSEDFETLFENEYSDFTIKPGSIVRGTVVAIDKNCVTIDTQLKSEAIIQISEFTDSDGNVTVEVGNVVDVAIDRFEDGFGETRLSREYAKQIEDWDRLEHAYNNDQPISGKIIEKIKGGLTVELGSVNAFLPGSLVDLRPLKDTSHLENTTQDFKIVKIDKERNNVIVSRKATLNKEFTEERQKLLDSLIEGEIVKGTVKNITEYGAFVDLGGIDGLLYITDISWKRIRHPNEVISVGDELDVMVLKFNKESQRISLGMRQLQANPWDNIQEKYKKGEIYKSRITNITEYGCFTEIEPGVEGLVHVTQLDWTNKNIHPSKVVSVGDEVDVMLLEIDSENQRMSFGIKQCTPNPWKEFSNTHNKGDKVSGPIKSITDFGIFIGLDGNIDGLVYLSDIDWDIPGERAITNYKKGQEVEVVVLGIDANRERISLGIKQLSKDPFMNYIAVNQKGTIVEGKVVDVDAKMVTVELAERVNGVIKAYELSMDEVKDASTVVSNDEVISAKIVDIDKKNRNISLSVRAKEIEQDKQAMQSINNQTPSKVATIGDLIKEQLDND